MKDNELLIKLMKEILKAMQEQKKASSQPVNVIINIPKPDEKVDYSYINKIVQDNARLMMNKSTALG